jgi:nitrogen-specific signal transduction histidine kinase/ActR/RegA family two-component response regulator
VEQLAKLAWETIDRKRAEEENKRLQMQFLQSQKMESIGRLAGGVAHDFNNMLSVILGHVEIALTKTGETEPLYEDLKGVLDAARRSANLTRQLLAFSRQQTVVPVALNLNRVVDDMLKMLGRMIREDIELVWKPGSDLDDVEIDPAQVEQILANLCVNAGDAICGAGMVVIETGNVVFDDTYHAQHFDFSPGRYVMLAVSDDGCGMEKEIMNHVFEPFFTTKSEGEGTGLGLSTVYGIVKQNDGFINVYSEPGRGTSIKIYFQRHSGTAVEPASEAAGRIAGGSGETILLVEDERMILSFAKRLLESIGYRVLTADSPMKAAGMIEEDAGSIDLVITDMVMPGMSGRELVERITRIRPDIKTIYMSGYRPDVAALHPDSTGNVAFLHKPFSRHDLLSVVHRVLAVDGGG